MPGPPNKWTAYKVSTTSDANGSTSASVVTGLNTNAPFDGVFSLVCSDGTFIFVGYYV